MMTLSRLEALVGAFANLNGALHPASRAYRNRNPLLLRAFSPTHEKDEEGYRVFKSFTAGWDNAKIDCTIKCSGNSHSRLKPDDTLVNLTKCYGNAACTARKIKNFLRVALADDSIAESQPLSWFLEDQEPKEQKSVAVGGE